ncbi:uncharacterized protein LOC6499925 isoform X2 [Drosophila ananassae]|uniref:uncharacterized protein LOC6499925 isoform X2 n=1 Tax=Drosophila ananassae TaxID=7217 RepID=UPI0013A5D9B8|nr:uncharacterized protein LOC6499925 isoform X2 [Drosophila ananassae]
MLLIICRSTKEELLADKYFGLVADVKEDGSYIIRGTFMLEDNWLRLKLYLPHYPALNGFELYVLEKFEYKLYTAENMTVQDDWQLEDFIDKLPQLLPPKKRIEIPKEMPPQGNIYADILALHKPNEYRLQINDTCTRIRFCEFVDFEKHYLELGLPSLELLDHSVPDCIPLGEMLEKSAHSLEEALVLFMKVLDDLRPFYENFMNIDELCHVLQPSPATTKHNSRVFPIKDRVYLKVTSLDPFACFGSMEIKIIGPTDEVSRLRHVLSDGLGNWDSELDMYKNLLRIFDLLFFPMPDWVDDQDQKKDEEDDEELRCNICFSYRLEKGEVPLVSCDNAKCVLKCHAACLKEWFQTQLEGKTFLEVSFGLCPFCKAKLSTSFAALLDE